MLPSHQRRLLCCATALLASCAVSRHDARGAGPAVDRPLQTDRLAQAARAGDLGAPFDQAPQDPVEGQRPQDRGRHIDEIEPPRAPRPIGELGAEAPYVVRLGGGAGAVAFHGKDTRFHDDGSIWLLRGSIEPSARRRSGPGLHVEVFQSSEDLFRADLMNDGQQVVRADAQVGGFDVFPHLLCRRQLEDSLELCTRLGTFVDWLGIDHSLGDVQRTWFGYGVRGEFEPTWALWRDGGHRLQLGGLLGADFGGARFREDFVGGGDSDDTVRWMHEAGVDVRYTAPWFSARVGYRYRNVAFGAVDTSLYGDVGRSSTRAHVLFLDAGISF